MSVFSDILNAITTRGRRIQIKMGLAKDFNDSKLKVGELGLIVDKDEVRIGLANGTTKKVGGVELSDIPLASTTQDGIMSKSMVSKLSGIASGANFVQVTDSVTSTSTTQAASANAVKTVNDKLGQIGTLSLLQTSQKSNLVDAINEVKQIGNNVKQNTVDALLSVDDSLPITSSSTWNDIIVQIGNIKADSEIVLPSGYEWATDDDFSGDTDGRFKYIGTKEFVIIPDKIKGIDVTSYYKMFESNNTIKGVSSFNNNATNIASMFNGCSSLTTLDLSNFNTSKVTNMSSMFNGCSSLTTLDLSNFNTSKVTNIDWMFYNCSNLTALDISNFNTSNATDMSYMFYNCSNLTTLDLSNFNTSNATNIASMFYNCSNLTTLDLSNFNTSKVMNMSYMFTDCTKVTTAYTRTQIDADKFNASSGKPSNVNFIVKP